MSETSNASVKLCVHMCSPELHMNNKIIPISENPKSSYKYFCIRLHIKYIHLFSFETHLLNIYFYKHSKQKHKYSSNEFTPYLKFRLCKNKLN